MQLSDSDESLDEEETEEEEEEEVETPSEESSEGEKDRGRAVSRKGSARREEEELPLAVRLQRMKDGFGGENRRLISAKRAANAASSEDQGGPEVLRGSKAISKARKSSHAPKELPANRPVPKRYTVIKPQAKKKPRDPRFSSLHGSLNEDLFRKSYGFLSNLREDEMLELQRKIQNAKDPDQRKEAQRMLSNMRQRVKQEQIQSQNLAKKRQRRKKEAELVALGKKPFFLKKSAQRVLAQKEKFQTLAKEGKVDQAIEKRRKRLAAKDHVYIPHKRRKAEGGGDA